MTLPKIIRESQKSVEDILRWVLVPFIETTLKSHLKL